MSIRTIEIKMPNNRNYLPSLLQFVHSIAISHGFDETAARHIELGVEEAVSNVLEHAYEPDEVADYDVRLELTPSEMMIAIHDMGLPFLPPTDYETTNSRELDLEEVQGKHLGTTLMRYAMDRIEYHNMGQKGKEIQLTKFIPSRNICSLLAADQLRPFEEIEAGAKLSGQVNMVQEPAFKLDMCCIRPIQDQDAIHVSRCAYRTYGYSYSPYIYYPEKILEKNRDGSIYSLVAASKDGIILGHEAMEFDYPGARIAEVGVLFVQPEYRCSGLAAEITARMVSMAQEMSLEGLYGRTVTSHHGSQKVASKQGFVNCGLQLGGFVHLNFKAMDGKRQGRESLALSYLPLKQRDPLSVHLPERYVTLANQIYDSLKMPVSIVTNLDDLLSLPEYSQMHSVKFPELAYAYIYVNSIGHEADRELRTRMRALFLEKTEVIYLFLDMVDPAIVWLTEKCRQMGFIFCGILPFGTTTGHDALIMQCLNNIAIDFDSITLFSDLAQDLLANIKTEWREING